MDRKESAKDFDKINELYSQYIEVVAKRNDADYYEKWAAAYKIIREKLIILVCKFYFKFEIKEGSSEYISVVTTKNKNDDDFSDVVVKEIINSLENYELSESKKNNYPFSVYVCKNVRNAKGKAQSKRIVSDNYGGSEITEYEASMVRKIVKEDKELDKFGIHDENKRNSKIAKLLDVSIDVVLKYKKLAKCNMTGMERTSSKDEVYSVIDLEKNLTERNYISSESICLGNELKEKLLTLMNAVDVLYLKKRDEKLSEFLTLTILKDFESEREKFLENKNPLENFYPDVYNFLGKYSCIFKRMLNSFFKDSEFVLPSQQDISDKYNLDKSAPTQMLKRFREKLVLDDEIADYFDEFIQGKKQKKLSTF